MMPVLSSAIATWFGCGLAPFARGTAGSLGAVAVAVPLAWRFSLPSWTFVALAAALLVPAVWAAGAEARRFAVKDPPRVVIDEVLGQWIALGGALRPGWKSWLAAFLLFRLFDIWKPFPVRKLEALPGGWGIVADDLMAGVYAALVLCLVEWFNFI